MRCRNFFDFVCTCSQTGQRNYTVIICCYCCRFHACIVNQTYAICNAGDRFFCNCIDFLDCQFRQFNVIHFNDDFTVTCFGYDHTIRACLIGEHIAGRRVQFSHNICTGSDIACCEFTVFICHTFSNRSGQIGLFVNSELCAFQFITCFFIIFLNGDLRCFQIRKHQGFCIACVQLDILMLTRQYVRFRYEYFCYCVCTGFQVAKFAAFHTDRNCTIFTCFYCADLCTVGFLHFEFCTGYGITCLFIDFFDCQYRCFQVISHILDALIFTQINCTRARIHYITFGGCQFCNFIRAYRQVLQINCATFCFDCCCIVTIDLFHFECCRIADGFACLFIDFCDCQTGEFGVCEFQAGSLTISYCYILRCGIKDITFNSGNLTNHICTVCYIVPFNLSTAVCFSCCSPCTFTVNLYDFILYAGNRIACFSIFFFHGYSLIGVITECCCYSFIFGYCDYDCCGFCQLIAVTRIAFNDRICAFARDIR